MPIQSNIDDFERFLNNQEDRFDRLAGATVEAINIEALEVAKSYTSFVVPGIRGGEGPRATHPGGWADRTSLMVNSFRQAWKKIKRGIYEGTLENTTEYSVYVEALGYWVLTGLFEGVIQEIARRKIKELVDFMGRQNG